MFGLIRLPTARPAIDTRPHQKPEVVMVVLILAIMIAYIDRQLLSLLVGPIKASLRLTDKDIGELQGLALNLCFGFVALPLGMLVDRVNRVRLIAASAFGWSAFTLLSAAVSGYWSLFVCRAAVGGFEAGIAPAAYSLIADLYPGKRRAFATLVFLAGAQIAGSAGMAAAGALIDGLAMIQRQHSGAPSVIETWRLAFAVGSLLGIVIGIISLFLAEPQRVPADAEIVETKEPPQSFLTYLRRNFLPLSLLSIGLGVGTVGIDALGTWMPEVLRRYYGWSAGEAGISLGVVLGVGSLAGIGLAMVNARLRLRTALGASPLSFAIVCTAAAAAVYLGSLPVRWPALMLPLWATYVFLAYAGASLGPELILEIAPASLRGVIYALFNLCTVLISGAIPVLIGIGADKVSGVKQPLFFSYSAIVAPCVLAAPVLLAMYKGRSRLSRFSASAAKLPERA